MPHQPDLVREVERALTRAPERSPSRRYAVYVPGAVVIGTYTRKAEARAVAARWTAAVPDVVVVDRRGTGIDDHPWGANLGSCRP